MLSLTAKDIMTRDIFTVHKGTSIEEALRLMACNNISGLPVVDTDNCLLGIITESDVLLKGQFITPEEETRPSRQSVLHPDGLDDAYRRAQATLVEDAMTRKVLAFMENSLVVDIARAMMECNVNRVPIVQGCQVVGIVSRRDIVKALANEANALEGCEQPDIRKGRLIEL